MKKARDEDEALRNIRRGWRVKEIRDDLEMTGEEFAEELTREARKWGLPWRYDRSEISRFERNTRTIFLDDAFLIASLDPYGRGLEWFILGVEPREPRERAIPKRAAVAARRRPARRRKDEEDERHRDSA